MIRSSVTAHSAWKIIALPETEWKNSILRVIGTQCQSLAKSHPRVYLLVAATFALVGYFYLLLFPWLIYKSGGGPVYLIFITLAASVVGKAMPRVPQLVLNAKIDAPETSPS